MSESINYASQMIKTIVKEKYTTCFHALPGGMKFSFKDIELVFWWSTLTSRTR